MKGTDIQPGQKVRYIGRDKFGMANDHTGQIFIVVKRSWNYDSREYLFRIRNVWDEERFNVPADALEEVQ